MNIGQYKTLISNLPVRQQCFTTKRTTWLKAENEMPWLKDLNDNLFGSKSSLIISRHDIFETKNFKEIIIKTIYWGYPAGMRGNNFVNILKHIDIIENSLFSLKGKTNLTSEDYFNLIAQFENIPGIGLSTYSKLLYFSGISFNGHPCIILDQRLIDVFSGRLYSNFGDLGDIKYFNAGKHYLNYLRIMSDVATQLETAPENIEQFLFIFGNNLKASC